MTPNLWSCQFINSVSGVSQGNRQGAYTASSRHPGTVNVLMGDGQVRSVSSNVDLHVWWAVGTKDEQEQFDNTQF
jgi:prepilin-type processing-associated H-X9-DG protein